MYFVLIKYKNLNEDQIGGHTCRTSLPSRNKGSPVIWQVTAIANCNVCRTENAGAVKRRAILALSNSSMIDLQFAALDLTQSQAYPFVKRAQWKELKFIF